MEEVEAIVESQPNWKPKVMLVGALIGALVGLGAAYLFVQRAASDDEPPEFSFGEGIKLGLLTLGTLRQIAQLGEKGK